MLAAKKTNPKAAPAETVSKDSRNATFRRTGS